MTFKHECMYAYEYKCMYTYIKYRLTSVKKLIHDFFIEYMQKFIVWLIW
jgi:hypothetical protein